jgi:hypothetical protein
VDILQHSHGIAGDLTDRTEEPDSLQLDDIQHFLMARPPALAARYEFLTFERATGGRAWLAGLIDKVGTAKGVGASILDSRWVTIGLSWNGLGALGLSDAALATFPDEFRQGMAARADILGMTDFRVPSCMPLPSCSPVISPNVSGAGRSMQTI